MLRPTGRVKPAGLDGTEKLDIRSRKGAYSNLFDIFETSLQDIANLSGEVIKIGEIDYADLNSLGSGTSLEVTFTNAKLAGEFFIRGFAKVSTAFTNQQYGYGYGYGYYSNNRILNVEIEDVQTTPSSPTPSFPSNEAQNIKVTITLESSNLQDWDVGVLDVYIEVKNYPSLS